MSAALACGDDSATTANPLGSATVLGGNDTALLAQHLEEVHPLAVIHRGGLAVEFKGQFRHSTILPVARGFIRTI